MNRLLRRLRCAVTRHEFKFETLCASEPVLQIWTLKCYCRRCGCGATWNISDHDKGSTP